MNDMPTTATSPAVHWEPKNFKLVATYGTSMALLAMVHDVAEQKLWGAGLDGFLYQVGLGGDVATPNVAPAAKVDAAKAEKTVGDQPEKKDAPKSEKKTAERRRKLHDNYVSALLRYHNGLVSASYDRTIAWWDLASGNRLHSCAAHDGWVRQLVTVPGRNAVVSAGDDMVAKLWNSESFACERVFAGHAARTPQGFSTALYALAVSPNGECIAAADRAGNCLVWETTSGRQLGQFTASEFYTYDAAKRARSIGGVRALRFSPNGRQLAVAGIGQVSNVDGFVGPCRLEVWDWQAGKREYAGQAKHQAIQNDVAFGPAGSLVTAGGGDSGGNLAFWQTNDAAPLHIAKPEGHVHRLALNVERREIYLAGHGGFQVWSVAD